MTSLFEVLQGPYEPEGDRRRTLSVSDVAEIRRLYATQEWRQVGLAEEFGVSQPQISKIVNNKQWRDDS